MTGENIEHRERREPELPESSKRLREGVLDQEWDGEPGR